MKKILFAILFITSSAQITAGIPYAGDITFYQDSINPLLIHIEISILTRDNIDSFADIDWGLSGPSGHTPVADTVTTTNGFFFEKYRASYQYVSDSTDSIANISIFMGNNRLNLINNIGDGNAVNITYCIKTTINLAVLSRDSFITSPVFLASSYAPGTAGTILTYNPQIEDLQGDSLHIQLVTPLENLSMTVPEYLPINEYSQQNALNDTFTFDSLTGVITWNKVPFEGYFDVAYQVSKYRNGQFIGSVMRDMLLIINSNSEVTNIPNNETGLQIYPNPTTGPLKITPPANAGNNYGIEITNILGQTVYKTYPNNNQVDVSSLAAGIYLLKITDSMGSKTAKFVKQ